MIGGDGSATPTKKLPLGTGRLIFRRRIGLRRTRLSVNRENLTCIGSAARINRALVTFNRRGPAFVTLLNLVFADVFFNVAFFGAAVWIGKTFLAIKLLSFVLTCPAKLKLPRPYIWQPMDTAKERQVTVRPNGQCASPR